MGGLLIFGALFVLVIGSQLILLLILQTYMPWFKAVQQGVPLSMYRLTMWRMTGVPPPGRGGRGRRRRRGGGRGPAPACRPPGPDPPAEPPHRTR
jgi:hypothetical protein